MSDLEIPVFASSKPAEAKPLRPEKILNPRDPKTWTLTPLGMFEKATCDYLIDTLRKRGSNAIVLNEGGKLEFAVVERSE
jgi:hypothetical protein